MVVRELDRLKDGQNATKRSRERARKTLVRFRELWANSLVAELRTGISLRALPEEPSIDFASHGLSRDWHDDQLIATVISYRERAPRERIVIVTRDVGPELKARHHGLEAVRLPNYLELADEVDPADKRLRELERQLAELKSAVPQLRLRFAGEDNRTIISVPARVSAAERIARRMAALREEYPKVEARRSAPPASSLTMRDVLAASNIVGVMGSYSPGEVTRYNTELDQFFTAYEEHLYRMSGYEAFMRLAFPLKIELLNEGTAPAEDLDVFLHFPDGFELFAQSDLPKAPSEPLPPSKPRTSLEMLGTVVSSAAHSNFLLPRVSSPGPPPNVSSPRIRRSNSYEVSVKVRRLKHGLSAGFDPLYLVFHSDGAVRSIGIDYRINAANTPKEATGKLHVVIKGETE
jgi:hypothetical protein